MHILVLMKLVPDVVEELEVDSGGAALDRETLRMIPSESDDHALEQALLLKERHGGTLTVLAVDAPEVDEMLYTALAKGADRAIKLEGAEEDLTTYGAAELMAGVISGEPGIPAAAILTGVQAIDDLDALLAPALAHKLGLPYLGIVTRLSVDQPAGLATAVKEFPGGVRGEYEVELPAIFGIQAAEKPPRYIPVAKVRAAMKSRRIEGVPVPTLAEAGPPLVAVSAMQKPKVAAQAQMIEGTVEEVSDKLCGILAESGLV